MKKWFKKDSGGIRFHLNNGRSSKGSLCAKGWTWCTISLVLGLATLVVMRGFSNIIFKSLGLAFLCYLFIPLFYCLKSYIYNNMSTENNGKILTIGLFLSVGVSCALMYFSNTGLIAEIYNIILSSLAYISILAVDISLIPKLDPKSLGLISKLTLKDLRNFIKEWSNSIRGEKLYTNGHPEGERLHSKSKLSKHTLFANSSGEEPYKGNNYEGKGKGRAIDFSDESSASSPNPSRAVTPESEQTWETYPGELEDKKKIGESSKNLRDMIGEDKTKGRFTFFNWTKDLESKINAAWAKFHQKKLNEGRLNPEFADFISKKIIETDKPFVLELKPSGNTSSIDGSTVDNIQPGQLEAETEAKVIAEKARLESEKSKIEASMIADMKNKTSIINLKKKAIGLFNQSFSKASAGLNASTDNLSPDKLKALGKKTEMYRKEWDEINELSQPEYDLVQGISTRKFINTGVKLKELDENIKEKCTDLQEKDPDPKKKDSDSKKKDPDSKKKGPFSKKKDP